MKKVVNKFEVAHLFANRLQDEARTPGNSGGIFFEGDTIYSYGRHFKIAKHVTNERGEYALLFTERGYSNTTAKHIGVVRNATQGLNRVFVSSLDVYTQDEVFDLWRNDAEVIAKKLLTARKPEIYLVQLGSLKQRVNRYAEFFSLTVPADLQYLLDIEEKGQFAGYADKKMQALKDAEALKLKQLQEFTDKQIEKFRNFETSSVHSRGYGVDYLRFNAETNRVETSQYVQIPAAIAQNFYRTVLDIISAGGCLNCNISLMERYQVKEITKKYIVVGCHKIEVKEIKALTKKLGW